MLRKNPKILILPHFVFLSISSFLSLLKEYWLWNPSRSSSSILWFPFLLYFPFELRCFVLISLMISLLMFLIKTWQSSLSFSSSSSMAHSRGLSKNTSFLCGMRKHLYNRPPLSLDRILISKAQQYVPSHLQHGPASPCLLDMGHIYEFFLFVILGFILVFHCWEWFR